ncbi:hypothetical protein [Catellatospora chokoriensis]|uniref:hypothetical protein n=1 Tax=Catellatospora chokoriensis TaxID=310353 RepID=UPI001945163A|nr:hypothetical protein [Catellatospora chokoriensis]
MANSGHDLGSCAVTGLPVLANTAPTHLRSRPTAALFDGVDTSPQPRTHHQRPTRPHSHRPERHTGHLPPVAVWHIRQDATGPDLTVADALRLLAVYTSRGGLIIDLDTDPALALVARAIGRRHVPMYDRRQAAGLDMHLGQAQLVALAWPRPGHDATEPAALLQAAAQLLDHDGHVLVSTATQAGQPRAEGHARLLDAAYTSGLRCVQRIVIVHTASGPDHFVYAGAGRDLCELVGDPLYGDGSAIGKDLLVCRQQAPSDRRPDRHTPDRDDVGPAGKPRP